MTVDEAGVNRSVDAPAELRIDGGVAQESGSRVGWHDVALPQLFVDEGLSQPFSGTVFPAAGNAVGDDGNIYLVEVTGTGALGLDVLIENAGSADLLLDQVAVLPLAGSLLIRTYDPGPGPSYSAHGDYSVTLTVDDAAATPLAPNRARMRCRSKSNSHTSISPAVRIWSQSQGLPVART